MSGAMYRGAPRHYGDMAGYRPLLNDRQIELLRWVAEGCPGGRYSGFGHRGSARRLEASGLLRIKGRGASWSAQITAEGDHYLEHGAYSTKPGIVSEVKSAGEASPRVSASPTPDPGPKPPKPRAAAYVRKSDLMMEALLAAPEKRLAITYEELGRYTRLVSVAERNGLVPDGMSLEITPRWASSTTETAVWLQPLPGWRTRPLEPLQVAERLTNPTAIVSRLDARADVEFDARIRPRAMRILDALVLEMQARGWSVQAGQAPLVTRPRRTANIPPDQLGHLRVQIDADTFHVCLTQVVTRVEHVATKSELARSGRGWGSPPKYDEVQSDELEIVLRGEGTVHWGSRWADCDDTPLERSLARVLQEVELRHQSLNDARAARARRQEAEQREWEQAKARALERFQADYRVHILLDRVKQLQLTAEIRGYADAVREAAEGYQEDAQRDAAREWADWAADYADSIDPLREPVAGPARAKASDQALAEYMHPWSPYGPHKSTSYALAVPGHAVPERRSWWEERSTPPWRR